MCRWFLKLLQQASVKQVWLKLKQTTQMCRFSTALIQDALAQLFPQLSQPLSHTRFLLVVHACVRCALFFPSGQKGIWAGIQAAFAGALDKKQHIHPSSSFFLSAPRLALTEAFCVRVCVCVTFNVFGQTFNYFYFIYIHFISFGPRVLVLSQLRRCGALLPSTTLTQCFQQI